MERFLEASQAEGPPLDELSLELGVPSPEGLRCLRAVFLASLPEDSKGLLSVLDCNAGMSSGSGVGPKLATNVFFSCSLLVYYIYKYIRKSKAAAEVCLLYS